MCFFIVFFYTKIQIIRDSRIANNENLAQAIEKKKVQLRIKKSNRLLSKVVKEVFLRRGRFQTCPLLSRWRDLLTQGGFETRPYKTKVESDDVDTIMTVKEASTFLDLAVQTMYGMTSRREIPFFKKGKRLYFKKSELLSWIDEGKRRSKGEIAKEAGAYIKKNK